jgi:hypothetical protein
MFSCVESNPRESVNLGGEREGHVRDIHGKCTFCVVYFGTMKITSVYSADISSLFPSLENTYFAHAVLMFICCRFKSVTEKINSPHIWDKNFTSRRRTQLKKHIFTNI